MIQHSHSLKPWLVIALLVQVAGCAITPASSDNSVRGRLSNEEVAYVKFGDRAPAVVLQAGFGDGKKVWAAVSEELAHDHTVFAYDRPGYGGNPTTETPRDPCTIATELRNQLREVGLRPPYILVGHSLGGLYQYVFARLYPDEVAGLVLLDPTHPSHWERMQHDVPSAANIIKGMRLIAFSSTMRREFDAQATCLDHLDTTHLPTVPTRILVSARFTSLEKGEFENMLKSLRQDWLRLTPAPRLEVIYDAGHYIQKDSPEDVVVAVRAVVAEKKKGSL